MMKLSWFLIVLTNGKKKRHERGEYGENMIKKINIKLINNKNIILIGVLTLIFLVVTYFNVYLFIPCAALTVIDLILIRNKIDILMEEKDDIKLLESFNRCVWILIIFLYNIIVSMIIAYKIYDNEIKLILCIGSVLSIIICIIVTYMITAIQCRILRNVRKG